MGEIQVNPNQYEINFQALSRELKRLLTKDHTNEQGLSKYEITALKIIQNEIRNACPISLQDCYIRADQIYKNKAKPNTLKKLEDACLPKKYQCKNPDDFPVKPPMQDEKKKFISAVKEFCQSAEGICLTLLGNVGTGKSYQAAAILEHLIRMRNINGFWLTNQDFAELVRLEDRPLMGLLDYDVLVIDDFLSKTTDAIITNYFALVENYTNRGKTLIVTGNFNLQKSENVLIRAIYSRLAEKPNWVLGLGWNDLRQERYDEF